MKYIKQFFYIMIFLISMQLITAIDFNNLFEYYQFESVSQNISGLGGHVLVGLTTQGSQSDGIIGNSLVLRNNQTYRANVTGLKDINFTINFWTYINSTRPSVQGLFNLGDLNSYQVSTSNYYTMYQLNSSSYFTFVRVNNTVGESDSGLEKIINQWIMVSLVFRNGQPIQYYLNGVLNDTISYSGIPTYPDSMNFLSFGYNVASSYIVNNDEFSIWNTTLNSADILYLYNSSHGVSYQTLSGANNPPEYPNFLFIDICIPINTLCHKLYYNQSHGAVCSPAQQTLCPIGCTDNATYYENMNMSPIGNNYSGYCSIVYRGTPMCIQENSSQCADDGYTVQNCQKDAFGVLKWINNVTCINGYYCSNGLCINEASGKDDDGNTGAIFDALRNLNKNTRYMIMLLTTIIIFFGTIIIVSGYGDSGVAGVLAGLVIGMITCLTLTIILALTLLIPILFILIGGAISAVLIRKIFTG